jgi:hypothetical protein
VVKTAQTRPDQLLHVCKLGLLTISKEIGNGEILQQQNILRFEKLLGQVTDEKQRKQIEYLIAQEAAKAPALKSKPPGE